MIYCSLPVGMCTPKADAKGGEIRHRCLKADCSSAKDFWFDLSLLTLPRPLTPNSWHTAVLHWQALCSCTHTKAASWRTALVSPAPNDSSGGSGPGVRRKEGKRCSVNSVSTLAFTEIWGTYEFIKCVFPTRHLFCPQCISFDCFLPIKMFSL